MKNRINQLKTLLQGQKIDYFILPNNDQFNSEYLPESEKKIQFLSGFDGSNAILVINVNGAKNIFFTDGRYTLQAANQLDQTQFEIFDLAEKNLLKWLEENIQKGQKVALDAKLHSKKQALQIEQILFSKKAGFLALKYNPVDEIIGSKSSSNDNPIFIFEEKYSGQKIEEKIANLLTKLDPNAEAFLNNFPPSINWLLNIRSSDIEFTPLALCHALIYQSGVIDLFVKEKRLDQKVKSYFKNHQINVIEPENLPSHLQSLKGKIKNVAVDPGYLNFALFKALEDFNIIEITDPILALKSLKNETEIKNNILAHEKDGLALTKFLHWLENNHEIDEITAADKLLDFRKEDPTFLYPSFETISSFGSNGAIIHYKVSAKTNKKFGQNNLYLVDSGGQYLEGTTDVTRTIAIGKPNPEQIANFTRVLKGHISIARAKFPKGTTGGDLDILARYNLWQDFKDYAHGTGHGVGQFLSVHESPPSISRKADSTALNPGMILSNEPGYYENGQYGQGYGIRIENLMLVEKTENDNFLKFKTLTLAPLDPNLIDFKMLTYPEKKWLFEYHEEILNKLGEKLDTAALNWLTKIVNNYKIPREI